MAQLEFNRPQPLTRTMSGARPRLPMFGSNSPWRYHDAARTEYESNVNKNLAMMVAGLSQTWERHRRSRRAQVVQDLSTRPTQDWRATDQRMEGVGLFLASLRKRRGIAGTLDENGKSLEKQKIAVS